MRGEDSTTSRWQRWLVPTCFLVLMSSFLALGFELAARLENPLWNGPTFSGWCAAVGHQIVKGRRLYHDLTLPMPPGSFVLMAWIERVMGHGPRLVYENRVCEICYALLAPIGYAIARPLAGKRVALFTAAAASAWASLWIKQLAYDALAEVVAWTAIALLVQAWVCERGVRERRWLFAAGTAAGATLIFKQSTAIGVFVGGLVGLGYLAFVERRIAGALRDRARGALVFAGGALIGAAVVVVGFGIVGGSMPGFLRAAFIDGAAAKGGRAHLVARVMRGLIAQPSLVWPLGIVFVFAALLLRILRRGSGLSLGEQDTNALRRSDVIGVATAALLVFGYGASVLAGWMPALPPILLVNFSSPQLIAIGLGLVIVFFIGNLARDDRGRRAHAFNAVVLAALVLASTVSTSMTNFNPFYENNAMMAVVLVTLFVALEHARVRGLSWIGLVIMMGQPLAWRLPGALVSRYPAPADSFLSGMWLNESGLALVRVAERVRAAAGPRGSVLSLPEDPVLETLVDRPQLDLCGAIVFPDQYPERCVAHDVALLDRKPPDVLVIRPVNRALLFGVLRIWRRHSPAEQVITHFLKAHLRDYRKVNSYYTAWVHGYVTLEIWRRRSAPQRRAP